MKRYSTSLAVPEIQIKTTIRDHYTPLMVTKTTTTNSGEDVEKLGHSSIAGKNVKWYSPSGK